MIDTNSGTIKALNPEILKNQGPLAAGICAGIQPEHQGPTFMIEELVKVKNYPFRVRGLTGGLLHLEPIPGPWQEKAPDGPKDQPQEPTPAGAPPVSIISLAARMCRFCQKETPYEAGPGDFRHRIKHPGSIEIKPCQAAKFWKAICDERRERMRG